MFSLRRLTACFAATAAVLCCLAFALATIAHADTRARLNGFIATVDASDGIDRREADGIAWAYFLSYVSGCGGPDAGTLVNGQWIVPAAFGYAGTPMDTPIRIDARTGAVSQAGGPAFGSYGSFRMMSLWAIPIDRLVGDMHEYYVDKMAAPQA